MHVAFFLAIPHRFIHYAKTFPDLDERRIVTNFYSVNFSCIVTRELAQQLGALLYARLVDRSDGIPARR